MFHVVLHPTDKLSVSHPMHVHSKTSAAFWDSIAQGGSSEDMRVHFQDMQRLSRSVVVPHMDVSHSPVARAGFLGAIDIVWL